MEPTCPLLNSNLSALRLTAASENSLPADVTQATEVSISSMDPRVMAALAVCRAWTLEARENHSSLKEGPLPGEPMLSTRQLLQALGAYLPRPPCRRTLTQWRQAAMPSIPLPRSPQRLFLLSAVLAWLHGRTTSQAIKQQAIDRTFTATSRRHRKRADHLVDVIDPAGLRSGGSAGITTQ